MAAGGVVRRGAGAIRRWPCARPSASAAEPARPLSRRPVPDRGRRSPLPVRRGLLAGSRAGRSSPSWRQPDAARGRRRAPCSSAPTISPIRSSSSHGRAIYMLPETGEAGRVELHRAVEFPRPLGARPGAARRAYRRRRDAARGRRPSVAVRTTSSRVPAIAASCGCTRRRHSTASWRPHPRNPIVTDPGRARPAGRLFLRDGVLVRPGQDGSRRYGGAVVLNRVDMLSPSEYRETPMERIEPDWMPGIEGTHTYTFDSRYECLDGIRRVRRLRIRR